MGFRVLVAIVGSLLTSCSFSIAAMAPPDTKPEGEALPQPRSAPGEVAPVPRVAPVEIIPAPQSYSLGSPQFRVSQYAVWELYAVDRQGFFRPRVIASPQGAYYLYNGQPFPWTSSYPRNYMPYVTD